MWVSGRVAAGPNPPERIQDLRGVHKEYIDATVADYIANSLPILGKLAHPSSHPLVVYFFI